MKLFIRKNLAPLLNGAKSVRLMFHRHDTNSRGNRPWIVTKRQFLTVDDRALGTGVNELRVRSRRVRALATRGLTRPRAVEWLAAPVGGGSRRPTRPKNHTLSITLWKSTNWTALKSLLARPRALSNSCKC